MSNKLLFIQHKGCNLGYLRKVLNFSDLLHIIKLEDFINSNEIEENSIILYQTWPDDRIFENGNIKKPIIENSNYEILNGKNHPKFPKDLIEESDLKFLRLRNKVKILVDIHDDADLDAFSRYSDNLYPFKNNDLKITLSRIKKNNPEYFNQMPRIKHTPSQKYINRFNVILHTTYLVHQNIFPSDKILTERVNKYHYFNGDNSHHLRPLIKLKLQSLKNPNIDFCKLRNYPEDLQKFMGEINVPGYGKICFRHLDTLNNLCLMFAYEDIKDVYLLPGIKLIENEDYISFNIDNLNEKINYCLSNIEKVNKIRLNSYKKFIEGYNYEKSWKVLSTQINLLLEKKTYKKN